MGTLAHELHDLVLQMDRSAEERLRPFGIGYRVVVTVVVKPLRAVFGLLERVLLGWLLLWLTVPGGPLALQH